MASGGRTYTGWRRIWENPIVAMVLALVAIVLTLGVTSAIFETLPSTNSNALDQILRTLVGVGAVVFVYKALVPRLGRYRRDDMPMTRAMIDLPIGIGLGAGLMTFVVIIAAVTGVYRIVGWGSFADALEIVLLAGVIAGVVEEIIARGIIFRFLEEAAGSWVALIASSLFFGFAHMLNTNATLWSSIAIAFEAGILLGGAYMLTRNLWLTIGIHAGWNVTQAFVWDVPVSGNPFIGLVDARLSGPDWLSGGAFGLEASVIALLVATGAGIAMVWKAVEADHWVRPKWSRERRRVE